MGSETDLKDNLLQNINDVIHEGFQERNLRYEYLCSSVSQIVKQTLHLHIHFIPMLCNVRMDLIQEHLKQALSSLGFKGGQQGVRRS